MANKSESKPRTVLNALVNNTTSYTNLDYNYGPYDNVDDAKTACVTLKAPVGFTVGVLEADGNALSEYKVSSLDNSSGAYNNVPGYFKYPGDANKIYTLVKKQTTGSTVNLDLTAEHSGTQTDTTTGKTYTTVTIKNNNEVVGNPFRVYDGKDGQNGSGGSDITIPAQSPRPLISNGTNIISSPDITVGSITGEYATQSKLKLACAVLCLGRFNGSDNDADFVELHARKEDNERKLELTTGNFYVNSGKIEVPNGQVNAKNGFYETSDARLKTDVQIAELDYDQILDKIRPVLYHWKFDQEGPLELGFIAQEIQELVPQVVSGEKQLSVNYAKLSTVALGACKHLMQRLNQLENRVKDIEEKLK